MVNKIIVRLDHRPQYAIKKSPKHEVMNSTFVTHVESDREKSIIFIP